MLTLPGVAGVDDLHVWTLTSRMDVASGHVVVADGADSHEVLDRVSTTLAEEYHIAHSTNQCEPSGHTEGKSPV